MIRKQVKIDEWLFGIELQDNKTNQLNFVSWINIFDNSAIFSFNLLPLVIESSKTKWQKAFSISIKSTVFN